MRPLELRLIHFGPYRDEAVLDFTKLDRLFLVCGPTGAGKTTLFDALTFALYERTPGTRAALTDQLVSHHAPEGAVPQVSLRFSLGDQEWRVTRVLKHRVPRLRGEGYRDQEPQVMLEKKAGSGWVPTTGKRSELNQRIEELIGLSADEFSKIVVLPQGDFQRFLEATSSDRERVLQKLFPIDIFERYAEQVKVRARDSEAALKTAEDRWQTLTERFPDGDFEADEQKADQSAEKATQAAEAETHAAQQLTAAKDAHRDWQTLVQRREQKMKLETRRNEVDALRQSVAEVREAAPWWTSLDRLEQLTADGKRLRADADAAQANLASLNQEDERWRAQESRRAERAHRLAAGQAELGQLADRMERWKQAQTLVAERESLTPAVSAAQARWEGVTAKRRELESRRPPEGTFDVDTALVVRDRAAQTRDEAAQRSATWKQRTEVEELWNHACAEVEKAETLVAQADRDADFWSQTVAAIGAAALAHELRDGQACPVCGALDHPHPAPFPQAAKEAPRRLELALRERDKQRELRGQALSRKEALEAQRQALKTAADAGADEDRASAALEQANKALQDAQDIQRNLAAFRKDDDQLRETEIQAKEAWDQGQRRLSELNTRLEALTAGVDADPSPRFRHLTDERARLEAEASADQARQETLLRDRTAAAARLEALEAALQAQRDDWSTTRTALDEAARGSQTTLETWRKARSQEANLKRWESEIDSFDRDFHRLDGEIEGLAARFPHGEPVPLEPQEAAWEEAKLARKLADDEAKAAEWAVKERERWQTELRAAQDELARVRADCEIWMPLGRLIDGKNTSNLRLTTWVLVQALEQVTRAATQRLSQMSGGRYALKVQSQGADGRRDWGLDLSVVDSHTGQERAVGTLSGGEKFLTSIALALGLADVIQERSGGLHLEVLFIDEGFGTLDEQSLDRAMAILHDLGQHRSVGIISHVGELRQRISSRVEVIKERSGSSLRVF